MIDYDPILVSTLKKILPTHDELTLHSGLPTPCISYQESNNYDEITGDTIGYSKIVYTIKVWSTDKKDLKKYTLQIDKALKPLGFTRTASNELGDRASTMRQKINTYEARALEQFEQGDE